jgi:hypothetical protein
MVISGEIVFQGVLYPWLGLQVGRASGPLGDR